jgi:hypothetical protein
MEAEFLVCMLPEKSLVLDSFNLYQHQDILQFVIFHTSIFNLRKIVCLAGPSLITQPS